jgi:hypothetical protein
VMRHGGAMDSTPEQSAAHEATFAAGSEGDPFPVGILFVHGMGEQERGDTITQMGDALSEWLRKELGNNNRQGTDFSVRAASLRGRESAPSGTASSDVSGRANVVLVLTGEKDGKPERQEWLLAESWWADAFRPATFGELVAWAIAVGPWLIASQEAGILRRLRVVADRNPDRPAWQALMDRVAAYLLVFVAALVAAVIAPLAITLLLLSLIPIPGVSDAIRGLVRNLSGSFGDLLVLVRSPVRFAAMTERVRGDIQWVGERAERVMIVAHSQGSAVAWQAIRRMSQMPEDRRHRVDLFLSFGQAFRKLKSLHHIHTRVAGGRQLTFALFATGSTILLVFAAWQAVVVIGTFILEEGDVGEVWRQVPAGVIATVLLFAAVAVVQRILRGFAESNDRDAEQLIRMDLAEVQKVYADFQWIDMWASADPAPNGPLFTEPAPGVRSYRIRNLASTILDHSVYWSNVTEFVSAVAFRISSLLPWSLLGRDPIPERLQTAAKIRESRVSMLALGRVGVVAGLATALFALRTDLPEIGDRVLELVGTLPLIPDWSETWHSALKGAVAAAIITVIAAAVWWLVIGTWRAVIRTDEGAFFGPGERPVWSPLARLWAVFAAVVPSVIVLWLAIATGDFGIILLYAVIGVLGILIILVLLRDSEASLGRPDLAVGGAEPDGPAP